MVEVIDKLASLTGWAPIALIAIVLIPIGIFFYTRELSNKDVTIQRLSMEHENAKQYTPSLLVQNLGQHVKEYEAEISRLNEKLRNLNNEVETETRKKSIIEQEKLEIQKQLDLARSEALELQERLEPLEKELDDLLGVRAELDFCRVCTVDEEHVMLNTIYWGGRSGKLVGDTALVEEGVCSYCASVNLKCKVCGAITGIDASATDVIECEGCYETLYTPLSFFGKKLDNTIKVSRLVSE
jgi:ribosomal protein S27E